MGSIASASAEHVTQMMPQNSKGDTWLMSGMSVLTLCGHVLLFSPGIRGCEHDTALLSHTRLFCTGSFTSQNLTDAPAISNHERICHHFCFNNIVWCIPHSSSRHTGTPQHHCCLQSVFPCSVSVLKLFSAFSSSASASRTAGGFEYVMMRVLLLCCQCRRSLSIASSRISNSGTRSFLKYLKKDPYAVSLPLI